MTFQNCIRGDSETKGMVVSTAPQRPLPLPAFGKVPAAPFAVAAQGSQPLDMVSACFSSSISRRKTRPTYGILRQHSHPVHLHFPLVMFQVAKLAILPLPTRAVEETDAKTPTNLRSKRQGLESSPYKVFKLPNRGK